MHRLIYFVFIIFILLSNIHLGLCSNSYPDDLTVKEDNDFDTDNISSLLIPTKIESIDENISDNITKSIITTITDEKQVKPFLIQYSLNVNLSSLSNITFNSYLNDSILLIIDEHEIFLINKKDGLNKNYFKYANIIPINQQIKQANFFVIFDDNTQELWIINSTHQQNSIISFKPKQIFIFPSKNDLWIAETSDELYISKNSGIAWNKIDGSSSSTILGWSNKENSVVIIQHSHYIKLIDLITYQLIPILNDVSSAKLFSHYLFAKRLNSNNSITISHVNNLADDGFHSLPKRLQSEGNFYCAIENINTQDLLLLFITENRLGENNETIFSTCNLISYSKQNLFSLSNIDCSLINNDSLLNQIECPKEQLPFYQVHGLSKNIFIANVGSRPTTMVSFDDGVTWNKTYYECDKMIYCPNNVSIVISSLISSNDAPGIIAGKASDGVNEYIAISSNGGRLWRLNFKGNNYLTAISNPNALILTIPNNNQQSSNHSFQYSTDYGRNWHQETFLNDPSFQILSLIADNKNIFYILTSNNENKLNLIQLNLNLVIGKHCARHQVKEWSLHNTCINGSKQYYKRRISGSHCLNEISEVRTEPCVCTLSDFECLPGYKRSKDGICLPKSYYIFSQDCTCNDNNTLLTKSRGYTKSVNSQCVNGIENYLSIAYITSHDPNHPNFFLYGIDLRTKRPTIEIHTNQFGQNNDEDDEDEDLTENIIWLIDQSYEITAVAFNETGNQLYIAVEHDQLGIIYRTDKNLRQQNRYTKQLTLDSNNELYRRIDERIEYLTIDWLTQNLYVLVRNKKTLQQTIFILDIRTRKRRTIIKNQQIQPPIFIIDPIKTDLYWISHNSPSIFNIGNLQGQIKKQIQLSSTDSNVSYLSYNPITHEIIYIINSNIYGLNTLDHHHHLSSRIIYEHSSIIQNALFVHPILYFTNENNEIDSSIIYLNAIDILAKSFAKNIAKFKDMNSVKLFIDMTPIMPTTPTINRCANNPCSDICIPLEHERFRCLCSDDARYQSCSCPADERFVAGSCQTKTGQCAPGRVLCQNLLNCAESARLCEQDHTQYTESFKTTARCTLDKPNDGFNCYYTTIGINNTCIPFEWLCDGVYDCPFGNDEEHCHKLTTTTTPSTKISNRCLTEKKFTHVWCRNKCMKIKDVCQNVSNALYCKDQFHLNCQQTHDQNQYVCKCHDDQNRCIAMIEQCDDFETCEKICKDSIHYANSKTNESNKPSPITWIILIIAILVILVIAIILITFAYMRHRKNAKNTSVPSRTPAAPSTTDSPPSDTREKLLNNASNVANETN